MLCDAFDQFSTSQAQQQATLQQQLGQAIGGGGDDAPPVSLIPVDPGGQAASEEEMTPPISPAPSTAGSAAGSVNEMVVLSSSFANDLPPTPVPAAQPSDSTAPFDQVRE